MNIDQKISDICRTASPRYSSAGQHNTVAGDISNIKFDAPDSSNPLSMEEYTRISFTTNSFNGPTLCDLNREKQLETLFEFLSSSGKNISAEDFNLVMQTGAGNRSNIIHASLQDNISTALALFQLIPAEMRESLKKDVSAAFTAMKKHKPTDDKTAKSAKKQFNKLNHALMKKVGLDNWPYGKAALEELCKKFMATSVHPDILNKLQQSGVISQERRRELEANPDQIKQYLYKAVDEQNERTAAVHKSCFFNYHTIDDKCFCLRLLFQSMEYKTTFIADLLKKKMSVKVPLSSEGSATPSSQQAATEQPIITQPTLIPGAEQGAVTQDYHATARRVYNDNLFFNNELGELWQNFTRQVESIQNIFLLLNRLLPGQDTVSGNSIGGSVKSNPLNIDGSGTPTLFSKIDMNADKQEEEGQPLTVGHTLQNPGGENVDKFPINEKAAYKYNAQDSLYNVSQTDNRTNKTQEIKQNNNNFHVVLGDTSITVGNRSQENVFSSIHFSSIKTYSTILESSTMANPSVSEKTDNLSDTTDNDSISDRVENQSTVDAEQPLEKTSYTEPTPKKPSYRLNAQGTSFGVDITGQSTATDKHLIQERVVLTRGGQVNNLAAMLAYEKLNRD
ncbi:hypothetical protein [Serratia symbiotica]|uniref:Uncharacterized protein n=1 Tax=Serratia symbiotica TaxID=138074 RepID=A0A068ZDQ9_9GAMM|nr:hypothetical protein [Serratia symbiotica]MBF1996198.1 hypothetical protein [Serratia symbiotica]MBQ0954621.1 hypothetical protein [Serratia symbiotica]QLH63675.1 hypothetical protein SYMBAF_13050 [Serratia symbiotica]QTP14064.1 hypothetical protein GPZ83_0011865 [Serratia symbiotica]CDS59043.1 conserved hypothetical protein (putative yspA) [Serratia symbiotica]